MTQIAQAYEQGQQANFDGLSADANPYTTLGDIRAAWWNQGWNHAQIVREEWESQ